MSTSRQGGSPLNKAAALVGGWSRLLLLVLFIAVVVGGLVWERQRHVPVPPGAIEPTSAIAGDLRQTTFRYPGPIDDVRAFYQQALPPRGWRYCGSQTTEGCSNLPALSSDTATVTDVYRREDDQNNSGTTIEIQPITAESGQTYVTLFETRAQ